MKSAAVDEITKGMIAIATMTAAIPQSSAMRSLVIWQLIIDVYGEVVKIDVKIDEVQIIQQHSILLR